VTNTSSGPGTLPMIASNSDNADPSWGYRVKSYSKFKGISWRQTKLALITTDPPVSVFDTPAPALPSTRKTSPAKRQFRIVSHIAACTTLHDIRPHALTCHAMPSHVSFVGIYILPATGIHRLLVPGDMAPLDCVYFSAASVIIKGQSRCYLRFWTLRHTGMDNLRR
jgi:hypothetical protein